MAKKKSKGVLKKIGEAVASGAEVVIDAGAKVVHSVGEMMPTGKTPPKRAKASPKAKAAKSAPKKTASAKTVSAKTAKPETKTAAVKVATKSAKPPGAATKKKAAGKKV